MTAEIVLGLTGMPGSGKSTFAEVARGFGFEVVVMGDFLRAEAERRGLKADGETLRSLMVQLRRERGEAFLAKLTVEAIQRKNLRKVLIDGVRSPAEVEEFRKSFPCFKLIAVHAPQEVRFRRLTGRGRSDDPEGWESFIKRDLRELEVGVGSAMALADRIVENLGEIEEFKVKVSRFLREVLSSVQAEG